MGRRGRGCHGGGGRLLAAAGSIVLLLAAARVEAGAGGPVEPPPALTLLTFTPTSVDDLVETLDAVWAAPRELGTIPNVAPDRFPHGMDELPVEVKKETFLRALAPHVVAANLWIAYERDYLLETLAFRGAPNALSPPKRACLVGLARRYRVPVADEGALFTPEALERLRRRVDVVPVGLVLAQAAIESGWGASRFARLANNLFGQWVFSSEKGLVPRDRPEGAEYAVARFEDLGQSVGAYLYNLNTFGAYRDLRRLRREMREEREPLDSRRLAAGLRMYSERRDAYVEDVRVILRFNDLAAFDATAFTRRGRAEWAEVLDEAAGDVALRRARLIAPFEDPTLEWSRWEGRGEGPPETGSEGGEGS